MKDDFGNSEKGNSLGIAESRAHSRAPMRALAYIELSDGNGGLILNISEDGLAVQAVQVVSAEQLSHMRFRLPKTSIPIEVTGRLVWQLRSKKEAGIQFVNLSEEARQGIREWIGTEASRPAAESEVPLKTQPDMTMPAAEAFGRPRAKAPTSPPPAAPGAPNTEVSAAPPTTPTTPAPATAVPPKSKPKEPPPPVPEPTIVSPRIPMPPSPAPPGMAAHQSASTVLVQQQTALPSGGRQTAATDIPASKPKPPIVGSAFPAGRLPLRPPARPETPVAQGPLPGAMPNMPRWKSYGAPGMGIRYRKPRGWWRYAAALGIIAAVGFAGLMMIDPGTISRARLTTVTHNPDATANVPQVSAANNGNASAPPPSSNSASVPATNGTTNLKPSAKPPQQTALTQSNTNPANGSGAGTNSGSNNAASGRQPTIPVNPLGNVSSAPASGADARIDRKSDREATPAEEDKRSKSDEPAREPARNESASQPAKEPAASGTQAPAGTSGTTNSANSSTVNAQAQPTSPATSPSSVPNSVPPTQASATQRDQDDYARTAKRESLSGASNTNRAPAQETAPAHTATASENAKPTVEVSGERSSPVAPSVPLIGVPSGSVGATSQFHAIRIPPELQSKAAQLAGNLQIGQMLSSYAPSYPVDAARAGVDGIVKLDVMIAPNGNVENVKIISGPPALTAVSISAVKEWHYGETLLGGHPVEAEQYVTLVFRLAK